jgi:hypothetical protein
LIEPDDAEFIEELTPSRSIAGRRRSILQYKELEAQGSEFNFIVVENGYDSGLVSMNDFAHIDGEASFGWGDFVSHNPGLITATALSIYSLGFDALGYARAHMAVPRSSHDLLAFHFGTGATLEFNEGLYSYLRFDLDTYEEVRNDAIRRYAVNVPETV